MTDSVEATIKAEPTPAIKPDEKAYTGPAYIPEKFRTAEDPAKAMADAYAELEKKIGTAAKPEPTAEEKAAAEKAAAEAKAKAGDTSKAAPLDPYFTEYAQHGKLTDESYAKLEEAGYSRAVVDGYIAGQDAIAERAGNELKASVGGAETYDAFLAWGETGLTEAERNAYDGVLKTGDIQAAKTMAAALVAKFKEATGQDPSRTVSGDRAVTSVNSYTSRAQMLSDMSDPRYRTDQAFREEVERKAMRSKF